MYIILDQLKCDIYEIMGYVSLDIIFAVADLLQW